MPAEAVTVSAVPSEPWWRAPGGAACLAAAAALTLLIALPVLRAPTTRIFGNEIVGRYHDAYTSALNFQRLRAPALHTQPATDYLGALAARAVGGVAAYNLVVLASFPLAAWFAYLLAYRISRSSAASWLAAFAYAFAPFHLAHSAYHPHIAQTHWIPFYLLALWLALERASWGRIALLLAALGLVALSNFYGGLIALVVTPIAIAGAWIARARGGVPRFGTNLGRVVAAFLLVGLGGVAYVRLFASEVLSRPASLAFPAADLARYTARWYSYLVPPVEHPLFGARARAFWERVTLPGDLIEQQLTIGFGLLGLALVAIGAWWRDRRRPELRWVPALLLLGGTAFLFSLAPVWSLFGFSFRAPSGWLYQVAPMFRAHARFGLVVILAVALLAAIGLSALLRRRSRRAAGTALALVATAAFELTPLPPLRGHDVLPTEAHRFLREQGGSVKVIDCVSKDKTPSERGVPALFGPGLYQLPPWGDCSEPGYAGQIAARGFTHAIVRRWTRDGDLLERRGPAPGFRLVREFESSWLLSVEAAPTEVYLELSAGFYRREPHDRGSFRWMGQQSRIRIVNAASRPRRVTLRLTLHSMPHPRRVLYSVGALAPVELGAVTGEPTPFTIGPLELAPGITALQLWSAEPATVVDSVLHNGDQRELALALWEWEIVAEPQPAKS